MSPRRQSKKSVADAPQRKRGDLSRDKLIAVALDLLDERGADALTVRAVADAAGVTPMALYNYFSSKRDLLAAVADHVIGATEFDGGHANWRDQIDHCFRALRSLCLRHPGLPGLLEQDGAAPASVFAPMDVTLRALGAAGLDDLDSTRTYFLLISFTLAQAAYQTRGPIEGLEPSEQIRAERIAGRGYTVTERLDLPPRWDFDASFAFGLSLIVAGIEALVSSGGGACNDQDVTK
jgi:TetR/AcrR family transcriptional regulator, tetracycline repressor protein